MFIDMGIFLAVIYAYPYFPIPIIGFSESDPMDRAFFVYQNLIREKE
jgi:hypothetical protein